MNTLDYILNKYDLTVGDKPCIEIPGVSRLDFIRWIRELDFKTGAEIGVAQGEFSKLILVLNDQVTLYGVDPWEPYKDYKDYVKQSSFEDLWHEANHRLCYYKQFKFVRKYSMDAVKDFEDESLDFVYIDANHEYSYVLQDITEWAKKVKSGGMIAGHDYINLKQPVNEAGTHFEYGIRRAVQEYTSTNNINPWFVLGREAKEPKVVREAIRSWCFVKP